MGGRVNNLAYNVTSIAGLGGDFPAQFVLLNLGSRCYDNPLSSLASILVPPSLIYLLLVDTIGG